MNFQAQKDQKTISYRLRKKFLTTINNKCGILKK